MPFFQRSGEPIEVDPVVDEFELSMNLPLLLGSMRQVGWSRIIRFEFLKELLDAILPKLNSFPEEIRISVSNSIDAVRNERDSKVWIEEFRHHRGEAAAFVIGFEAYKEEKRLANEAKIEAAKENLKKSLASAKLTRAAGKWEKEHQLPKLVGLSTAQENLGRRCRFLLMQETPDAAKVMTTDAVKWITDFQQAETKRLTSSETVG